MSLTNVCGMWMLGVCLLTTFVTHISSAFGGIAVSMERRRKTAAPPYGGNSSSPSTEYVEVKPGYTSAGSYRKSALSP